MITTAVLSAVGQPHLPSYSYTGTVIGTILVLIIIAAGAIIAACAYRHSGTGARPPAGPRNRRVKDRHV